ncbi:MAG: hypothetical protein EOO43_20435, partial [Flavobacterium sp.]
MLYFKKHKDSRVDDYKNIFPQYEEIFIEEESLLFLFYSLDKLFEIQNAKEISQENNLEKLFKTIEADNRFFWNSTNEDSLFSRIVRNTTNEDPKNKILLFAILHYMIKHDLSDSNESLKRYVRILRNLLQATRQRNETKYNTNIRINDFGSYWVLFEQLATNNPYQKLQDQSLNNKGTKISDPSLTDEIEKTELLQKGGDNVIASLLELEQLKQFGGLIHLLKPRLNYTKFQSYLNGIKEIWDESISDTYRIQALVACGFDGIQIKENIKMGETYYFGRKGNWDAVLTSQD